ncbi:MAG: hypothetical protein HY905_07165 [Deltaproteobacteria bacterium]|nr:hypothetical protein [Deltaproteobacteria bacterium]
MMHATKAPDVEQAITEAERVYVTAVRRYRRSVGVVCHPRVAKSVHAVAQAGLEIEKAANRLAATVCRRLGVEDGNASKLCNMLHDLDVLDPEVDDFHPGMPEHAFRDFPRRRTLDEWVVRDGRELLKAFARVGRLDLDSTEGKRLLAFVRVEDARLEPVDQPAPVVTEDRHLVVDPRAKRALRDAQQLLDRAKALGDQAVEVLCTPEVRLALDKAEQAAELVEQAMKVAGAPVLARLGLTDRDQLYDRVFVDATSWGAIEDMRSGLDAGRYTFYESLAIPKARYFRSELVDRPREALADLTRVLALPAGSAELRALRATVRRRERPGRRQRKPVSGRGGSRRR